ncbi:MAG: aspartoacylase [Oleiphilaceae bacterium]|nr:aspartoacylase [Oleiphilaceae bacterium]
MIQVLIVGGTHGNERTGVQLIRRLQVSPTELERNHFVAKTLLANQLAMANNRRYLDQDLNRCFSEELLSNIPENREQSRAKEINEQFGPKGPNTQTDWIIDLHTTTANMGITLIVQQNDPLALDMALYVQKQLPGAVIFYEDNAPTTNSFLCSIAKHGFLIEVGPVAQGLLRWDAFEHTRQALSHALDFIDLQLSGQLSLPSIREADVFQFTEKLHLPRDESGEIIGMIHPQLQDQDYCQLSPGEPIFILDTGETVLFEYHEPVYVAFVNEAAYYDQAHGLSLMRKRHLTWTD